MGDVPASAEELQGMLRPCPADELEAHPVALTVSDVHKEGAGLLEPSMDR